MRSPAMRLSLLVLASSLALELVLAGEVAAQKKVRWKMPSAFQSSLDVVGESGPIFSENLRRMSGGALDVKSGATLTLRGSRVSINCGAHGTTGRACGRHDEPRNAARARPPC